MLTATRFLEPEVEEASPRQLERMQWDALEEYLRVWVGRSEFHRRRLAEAGLSLDAIQSLEDFRRLPLMRKADVLADVSAHPPFGSNLTVPRRDLAQIVETTGTSGQGCEVYALNREDEVGLNQMEATGFYWAGVESGWFVATTYPITTRAAGRWHQAAVHYLHGVYIPLGTYDTETKLQYFQRLPIDMVVATPSYIRRLEVAAEEMGLNPRSFGIRSLVTGAEPFTTEWVEERQDIWGATLYEQYGSSQRAFAWTCEGGAAPGGKRGVLHTLPHLALYEVLNRETGEHVEPGECGEVVITPFSASRAVPLLRFATGDRVRWLGTHSCECGRSFPALEAGNIQRFDDMLKVKGVNIFPETLDTAILHDPIFEYEGIVELDEAGRERVRIAIEFSPGTPEGVKQEQLAALRQKIPRLTGVNVRVEEHTGPSLVPEMRIDMKKRRRWTDLRRIS